MLNRDLSPAGHQEQLLQEICTGSISEVSVDQLAPLPSHLAGGVLIFNTEADASIVQAEAARATASLRSLKSLLLLINLSGAGLTFRYRDAEILCAGEQSPLKGQMFRAQWRAGIRAREIKRSSLIQRSIFRERGIEQPDL